MGCRFHGDSVSPSISVKRCHLAPTGKVAIQETRTAGAGEGVGQREASRTAGGSVTCCSHVETAGRALQELKAESPCDSGAPFLGVSPRGLELGSQEMSAPRRVRAARFPQPRFGAKPRAGALMVAGRTLPSLCTYHALLLGRGGRKSRTRAEPGRTSRTPRREEEASCRRMGAVWFHLFAVPRGFRLLETESRPGSRGREGRQGFWVGVPVVQTAKWSGLHNALHSSVKAVNVTGLDTWKWFRW